MEVGKRGSCEGWQQNLRGECIQTNFIVFSQAPKCQDFISTENREIKTNIKTAFRKQAALVVSVKKGLFLIL